MTKTFTRALGRKLFCLFQFLLLILIPAYVFADGDGSLNTSYSLSKRGLNYVSASQITAQRSPISGTAIPTFAITGIPAGAIIEEAYFYMGGLTRSTLTSFSLAITNPANVFTTATASAIGSSGDICWSSTNGVKAFRVSIKGLITGNGNYKVSGIPTSASGGDDINGATIIVIYSNPTANYIGNMLIKDGSISVSAAPNTATVPFNKPDLTTAPIVSKGFGIVVDVQFAGGKYNFPNGVSIDTGPPYWYNFYEADLNLTPAVTNYDQSFVGANDCFQMMLTGLYYQTAIPTPVITFTSSLAALNTTYGTASSSGTFNVSGTNMQAGILVTPPAAFEVSLDGVTFTNTVTVGAAGTVTSLPVYVRLKSTNAIGSYSGNVVLSSTAATSVNVTTVSSAVSKATTTIALSNLLQTYDGTTKSATATTNPAGLSGVSITYNGSATVPTAAGTYAIVASLSNTNYVSEGATGSLVIAKQTATLALSNLTQTYDGTAKSATAITNPVGLSGVTITYDGSATIPTAAGTYAVVVSLTNANYTATNATGSLVIGKGTATLALTNLTQTYDGTTKSATATTNPIGLSGVIITYDGSTTLPTTAGTYTVVASLTNANYTATNATGSLVIVKNTATIALSNLSATYDGTAKSATATTNPVGLSGVSIIYDGSTTLPTAAGTYAVVASLTNANYTATNATGSLVIGKGTATLALSNLTQTYDGTAKSATATTNPVGLSGVTITYDGSATVPTAAGTYAVVASLNNDNYTATNATGSLVIGKGTATLALSNLTATYDGTAKSATATTNPVGLSGVTITYDGSTTIPTAAGTYAVVASLINANYTATNATGSLIIGKATATLALSNLTQTYDGTAKSATATTNPVGLSGVSITYDGSTTLPTTAGTYVVVASLTNSNYTATNATGSLIIGKGTATLALSNLTATYDGTAKSATAATNPAGLSGVSITYDGSATAPTAAGTYAVVASLNNANYTATNATGSLVIGKGTATLALSNLTQTYDGTAKSATATTNPVGLSGISITYGGSTTLPTTAGTYAVVASLTNANYTANNATGNLIIGKGTATVALSNLTATYDGSAKSATATTNPVGLSGVSITYDGSATVPTSAGTYAVVASLANANYTANNATGSLIISKGTATLALSNLTATYDGTAKSATATTNPVGLSGVSITYDGSSTMPTAAGTYTVVASLTNANYAASNATGSLVIGKGTATITLSNLTYIYDGTAKSATATTNPVGLSGVSITYDGSATIPTAAGTYAVVASLTNANYPAAIATGSLVISKGTATLALSNLTATYDGSAKSATATTNPVGLSGVTITYDGSATIPTAAGTYAVVASLTNANYTATNAAGSLVIGKAAATITLSNLTHIYDGTAKSATATTGPVGLSGVAVTYNGTSTLPTAAGTYTVVASLTNANYTATNATGSLVIGKKAVTVTVAAKNKTYGDADPALTYTNTPLVGAETFTGALARDAGEDVGTYSIKQGTLALSSNYTLTYVGGNLTVGAKGVTVTAIAKSKTYGDADPTLTYTNSPLIGTETFTGALTRDAGEDMGVYTIKQGTLALSGNYTLTYVGADLTIGAKAITVTATAKNKTYGDADPALTYTNTPLVGAERFTGALTRDAGEVAGAYAIKQGTLALSSNYTLSYTGANLTIGTKALTIAVDNKTKVYGSANPALTTTYTGFANGDDASKLSSPVVISAQATTASGVGTYPVTASGAASNNYTINYIGGTLTVTPATLNIAADNKAKIYGAANPALTASYTGFVNGDTNASLTTQPSLATVVTAASAAGTYPITVSGAASANYNISYTAGTLTVSNSTLTITAANASKTYGAANPALTFTYSGFVNGDTQASLSTLPTASTTAATASGAGTYPITVSGAVSLNYTLVYVPASLTVNKAMLNVSADNKSRNYGVANPALTLTYSGFVNNDTPAGLTTQPTAVTNATAASQPGIYAIVASGAASANYTFSYSSGTFTVTPLTNATMVNLAISSGSLSPAFSGGTYGYKASVIYAVNSITLTPTADATATITVNGITTGSGSASSPIALSPGDNTITTVITAQDGVTKLTYTVVVHRAQPAEAIVVTNVLTPNGDGKNDTWVVKDIELYPGNKVTVYDVAGRELYSKKDYTNNWGGTVNNAQLAQGTYYYVVDLGPGYGTLKGFITIVNSH